MIPQFFTYLKQEFTNKCLFEIAPRLTNLAKNPVEKGNIGGIGTKTHKTTVVGDTVGDPFKDAAVPSLDFLMNPIGSMATLFATSFITLSLIH